MKIGGYQILDFKKSALSTEAGVTIEGLYEILEGNIGKRVVVSGLVIGDTEYNDATVEVTVSGTDFVFTVYGYDIAIDDDDEVTVATHTIEVPLATETVAGIVKKAGYISSTVSSIDAPTVLASLIDKLKEAGIMATV